MKPRYRIVYDSLGIYKYKIQMKYWWLPFWIDADTKRYKYKEGAKQQIELYKLKEEI